MNKIEHTRQLLNELADLDYLNLSSSEIRANRKKLRKEIEVLSMEIYEAKSNGNQEYKAELYDLREEVSQLRDKMENKRMKFFQKLGKIHTIIGIIALVVLFGATGIKMLKAGDSELSSSVKYATQEGITNEDIFNAIDTDSNWFAGTTDDGVDFVEVEFKVSIDLDEDGINELENISIQWKVETEKYRFHVLSINGAVQNQAVGGLLYAEILERGIRANSSSDNQNLKSTSAKAQGNNEDSEKIETIDQDVNSSNNSEDVDILFNSNQELLNFLNDNRFLFIDDVNWFFEFDTNQTVSGILNSGYLVERRHEVIKVNYNENFIIINILETTKTSEDGTTIDETNFLQKLIIEENILQIITFFGAENEVTSYWILADD